MTAAAYEAAYPGAPLHSDTYERWLEGQALRTAKGMRKPGVRSRYLAGIAARDQTGAKNPFFGKTHSEEFKRRQSENLERIEKMRRSSQWWYAERRGKTVEEIYGEEEGARIRALLSTLRQGELNPAFGKVYAGAGGKGTLGWYKGRLFRSAYEYSFYKHLEQERGSLDGVEYEPLMLPVWKKRNYVPDFLIDGCRMVEIKSKWWLQQSPRLNKSKFKKAQEYCTARGWTFEVLTEDDFSVLPLSALKADPDVVLAG